VWARPQTKSAIARRFAGKEGGIVSNATPDDLIRAFEAKYVGWKLTLPNVDKGWIKAAIINPSGGVELTGERTINRDQDSTERVCDTLQALIDVFHARLAKIKRLPLWVFVLATPRGDKFDVSIHQMDQLPNSDPRIIRAVASAPSLSAIIHVYALLTVMLGDAGLEGLKPLLADYIRGRIAADAVDLYIVNRGKPLPPLTITFEHHANLN